MAAPDADVIAPPHPSDETSQVCGVNVAFGVVGGKWKPTILWLLSTGRRRFAELRRGMPGISEKVLAQPLSDLQRDGLVDRRQYPGYPLHVEYLLTDDGRRLEAALDAVAAWGDAYVKTAAGGRRRTDLSRGGVPRRGYGAVG
ncbi:winged helix-turn-helix transcriptional regulator [Millisia brevis]|uniref:winged helix-turn-helix transcriptional regulator n=1 Tax=Millisia brevis TaxID=264148 RepID=UPI0009FF01FB|nr:helix-turn-helix domain-containing protein [Millisia brevis]